jgi:hypothetical protein
MDDPHNSLTQDNDQRLPTSSHSPKNYIEWLRRLQSSHRQFVEPLPADANFPTSAKFVDKDLVWKQYQIHVDLYKHYLDLVIKFNAFYYAITGAFLSYYFSHINDSLVRWSLVFPIVMGFFFSVLFLNASRSVKYLDEELENICWLFGFTRPETKILTLALVASGLLFGVIAIGLTIAFVISV